MLSLCLDGGFIFSSVGAGISNSCNNEHPKTQVTSPGHWEHFS